MEDTLKGEAKAREESLSKHILLAVKEEKSWREVVQTWTQRKLHLLEYIERDHALATQTTRDESAFEDLKKQLSEDYLLLAKIGKALDQKVSDLRETVNRVLYPLLQSSLPKGYEMVEMPYCGYFRATGGKRSEHLAVKKGVEIELWSDADENDEGGVRIYRIQNVPKNEIVYFWDADASAWKELFRSASADGMRQWRWKETWEQAEPLTCM